MITLDMVLEQWSFKHELTTEQYDELSSIVQLYFKLKGQAREDFFLYWFSQLEHNKQLNSKLNKNK